MSSLDDLKFHRVVKETDREILRHTEVRLSIFEAYALHTLLSGKTSTSRSATQEVGFKTNQWNIHHFVLSLQF